MNTTGSPPRPSWRASARMPPIPPVSPGRDRNASRRSSSRDVARPGVSGRPYPDGPDHQVDRSRAPSNASISGRGSATALGRRPGGVEEEPAVVETAEIEAHRPRIDPHDPRHPR